MDPHMPQGTALAGIMTGSSILTSIDTRRIHVHLSSNTNTCKMGHLRRREVPRHKIKRQPSLLNQGNACREDKMTSELN